MAGMPSALVGGVWRTSILLSLLVVALSGAQGAHGQSGARVRADNLSLGQPGSGARQFDLQQGTATAQTHPWKFNRRLGKHAVVIKVGWTACTRGTIPRIRIRVRQKPGRAMITAIVHRRSPPPATKCLRLRGRKKIRVRLRGDVSGLKLFDGSFSPPKLRWVGKAVTTHSGHRRRSSRGWGTD